VRTECKLELTIELLDVVKRHLILPLVLFRGHDRLTFDDLTG
jgi:hypothetical protein